MPNSFYDVFFCPLFVCIGLILLLDDANNRQAKEKAANAPPPIPKSLTKLDLALGISIRLGLMYAYLSRKGLDLNPCLGFIIPIAFSFTSWGLHLFQKNFCFFKDSDSLRHATSFAHFVTTISHMVTYHRICIS